MRGPILEAKTSTHSAARASSCAVVVKRGGEEARYPEGGGEVNQTKLSQSSHHEIFENETQRVVQQAVSDGKCMEACLNPPPAADNANWLSEDSRQSQAASNVSFKKLDLKVRTPIFWAHPTTTKKKKGRDLQTAKSTNHQGQGKGAPPLPSSVPHIWLEVV